MNGGEQEELALPRVRGLVLPILAAILAVPCVPQGIDADPAPPTPFVIHAEQRGWQRVELRHRGSVFHRKIDFPEDAVLLLFEPIDVLDSEGKVALDVRFEPGSRATEWIQLGFVPTRVTFCGAEALVAAGRSPDGASVVTSWPLTWPDCMPEPELERGEADPLRPEGPPRRRARLRLAPVSVGAPRELLREPSDARGPVRSLVPIEGRNGPIPKVLALFEENGDLATIDLDTGLVEPLASGAGHAGRFGHVPTLGSMQPQRLTGYRDAARGLVYLVEPWAQCVLHDNHRWLALVDSDRDGEIDDHSTWDVIDWFQFISGDPTALAEHRAELPPPPRK